MHISSATLPISGNSSHICWPDLPNVLNPNCGPKQFSGLPCNCASCCPLVKRLAAWVCRSSCQLRLVIECFQMRGPAGLIKKNHALGLGRMMQGMNHALVSPFSESLAATSVDQKVERNSPSPVTPRPRNARLFIAVSSNIFNSFSRGNHFVQIQNRSRHITHRREFGRVRLRPEPANRQSQQLPGVIGICLKNVPGSRRVNSSKSSVRRCRGGVPLPP